MRSRADSHGAGTSADRARVGDASLDLLHEVSQSRAQRPEHAALRELVTRVLAANDAGIERRVREAPGWCGHLAHSLAAADRGATAPFTHVSWAGLAAGWHARRVTPTRRSALHLALFGALSTACKSDTPASSETPAAPADPTPDGKAGEGPRPPVTVPDEPLAKLRSGAHPPKALDPIAGKLVRHFVDGAEYFELELDVPNGDVGGIGDTTHARIDGMDDAIVALRRDGTRLSVLVRRPSASPTTALAGSVWFNGWMRNSWSVAKFTATGTPKEDRELPRAFVDAFALQLRSATPGIVGTSPFHQFAAGRIYAAVLGAAATPTPGTGAPELWRPRGELSELMYTTTAATSMQEALQFEKGLGVRTDDGARTVPLAELQKPALADHPFAEMQKALPAGAKAEEPLAAATPAEFWYLRFSDIREMLRVLDEADAWITPVAHALEERPLVRDLADRYQRELGLGRSGLAKTLGHTAVSRLAVMGSDPYLREGSDVTMVFEVASQTVFDAELAKHLETWRSRVPDVAQSELVHEGHTITVHRDPQGLVRRHQAQIGALAVVSNSEHAIKRVLDAIDGKRPRLSEQADLQYMLARDPGEHDAFAFIGDRFVAEVVGPAQKVQQARRMQALAELSVPGHAALLYGWLNNRAPADTAALTASGVLTTAELVHTGGDAIEFTPGSPARSSWGRVDGLTPLIDLPPVELVTDAERIAYDGFSRGYQDYWRQFIDPIAIRLDVDGDVAKVDVRVLPLIAGTNYKEYEEIVGTQRIEVPAIDDGLQAVWAVGQDTELRREIDRTASMISGKSDLGLGWLGDWVMVGTLDRAPLLDALAHFDDQVQVPLPEAADRDARELEMFRKLGKLPVFAAADVRNPAGLVATLAAGKAMLNEVAPGIVTWENFSTHGDIPIVRIGISKTAPNPEAARYADVAALYYAQVGGALVVAIDQDVLKGLIDRLNDETRRPKGVEKAGTQFAIEARIAPQHAGWHALLWALQGQSLRGQPNARRFAEAILRGDPSTAGDADKFRVLANAYLGGVPVTPEGRSDWSLGEDGVRDPIHGSDVSPIFPELPIEGATPIGALMDRVTSLRASLSFDDEPLAREPKLRSLHTTFELGLGEAKE